MRVIDNVHVDSVSNELRIDRAAVGCDFEGNRYHYWIVSDDGGFTWKPERARAEFKDLVYCTIYKNPPLKVDRHDPAFFNTLRLRSDRGIGKMIFEATWPQVAQLMVKAIERAREKWGREAAERKAQARLNRINECADRMYALLCAVENGTPRTETAFSLEWTALRAYIEGLTDYKP